jgi:hypothetical protein
VYVGDRRRLRIKQFLYDYAPPAFDHPCLWESDRVKAFPVGDHLGWLGTDYRELPAATVNLNRTTVELSATTGDFEDEEFMSLCRGLRPADPEACHRILNTPLADLCYQSRHREPPIAVPVGYWAHKRLPKSLEITVMRAEPTQALAELAEISPPEDLGYRLDSLFIYGNPTDPQETDYCFQHIDDRGRYLRVLTSPRHQIGGVPYPPTRELRQPCSARVLRIRGREVHHAYSDENYGQHEAVWQSGHFNIVLIVKPTVRTNLAWFHRLLERMV